MKLDEKTKQSNRKPKNLVEFLSNQSVNNDFLVRLGTSGPGLRKLLQAPPNEPKLQDAIFVLKLNNCVPDLVKVTKLIEAIFELDRKAQTNSARDIASRLDVKLFFQQLINFYRQAQSYDEHYSESAFMQSVDDRYIRMNFWALMPEFRYDETVDEVANASSGHSIFVFYNEYFKNFLNTLYGDDARGLKFVGKSYREVSTEYEDLRDKADIIAKSINTKQLLASVKSNQTKRDSVLSILKKYPATVYKAVLVLLEHIAQEQAKVRKSGRARV